MIRIRPSGFRPPHFRPLRLRPGGWEAYTLSESNLFHVEQTALDRYELYAGVDAYPDLTAAYAAASATLPFTYALSTPPSGIRSHYLIVRRRNIVNLLSFNTAASIIRIGDDGEQVGTEPQIPLEFAIAASTANSVLVTGRYYFTPDMPNRADKWAVYSKVGSAPVPGVDSPTLVTMGYLSAQAVIRDYALTGYTTGQVVYVLLRTHRSADGVESTNTDALSVTVGSAGPSTLGGVEGILGDVYLT